MQKASNRREWGAMPQGGIKHEEPLERADVNGGGDGGVLTPRRAGAVTPQQHRTALDSVVTNLSRLLNSRHGLTREADIRDLDRRITATVRSLASARVLGAQQFISDPLVEKIVAAAAKAIVREGANHVD